MLHGNLLELRIQENGTSHITGALSQVLGTFCKPLESLGQCFHFWRDPRYSVTLTFRSFGVCLAWISCWEGGSRQYEFLGSTEDTYQRRTVRRRANQSLVRPRLSVCNSQLCLVLLLPSSRVHRKTWYMFIDRSLTHTTHNTFSHHNTQHEFSISPTYTYSKLTSSSHIHTPPIFTCIPHMLFISCT